MMSQLTAAPYMKAVPPGEVNPPSLDYEREMTLDDFTDDSMLIPAAAGAVTPLCREAEANVEMTLPETPKQEFESVDSNN